MKLLHIINSLNKGGAEKLLVESLPLFVSSKDEVEILVLSKNNDDDFLESCKRHNIKVTSLNSTHYYNPLLILKIRKVICQFDLVHVHLFPCQYWTALACLITSKKKRPLLVTSEHSVSNRRRKKVLFKVIDKFIYRLFDSIICVSDSAFQSLKKYLGTTSKIAIIENGIKLEQYQTAMPTDKSQFNFLPSDYIITMVGGFRHEKDQDTLIKSMQYLPNNFKLLLVGKGYRMKECQELVSSLNLSNRVYFSGVRNDVANIFKMSDICVMSSHWEGLSLVVVEAMATGTPVIGSNVPGIAEIVESYGLLFEKGDFYDLAQCITKLSSDDNVYTNIAKKCSERALHYDIKNMVNLTSKIYNSLMK